MAKKQKIVCQIIIKRSKPGTNEVREVMPVVGRLKGAERMARFLEQYENEGWYIRFSNYKGWGRYKRGFNRLALESFNAQHSDGSMHSYSLHVLEEGEALSLGFDETIRKVD